MENKKSNNKQTGAAKEKRIQEITALLNTALAGLKEGLGEKKFEKRIKKAARYLLHGKTTLPVKKAVVKKKAVKKLVKKSLVPLPIKKAIKAAVKK